MKTKTIKTFLLTALLVPAAIVTASGKESGPANVEIPAGIRIDYLNVKSANGRSAVFDVYNPADEKYRYTLLRDESFFALPEMAGFYTRSVSDSGYVLLSDYNCNLKRYRPESGVENIATLNVKDCSIDNSFINDSGQALVQINASGQQQQLSPLMVTSQGAAAVFPEIDSSYVGISLIALTANGTAYGYYTKLVNGIPETRLFKYEEGTGRTELQVPAAADFFDSLTYEGILPTGEIILYSNQENTHRIWNPDAATVKLVTSESVREYLSPDRKYQLKFNDGKQRSLTCAFENSASVSSEDGIIRVNQANTLYFLYGNNKSQKRIGKLDLNQVYENTCIEPDDIKLQVSGACKKFISEKSDTSVSFSNKAEGLGCEVKFKARHNGKNVKNLKVERKVSTYGKYLRVIKTTDKQGKVSFKFKVSKGRSTDFIFGKGSRKLKPYSFSLYESY